MKKILLFHIYPVNHWKEVTQQLLSGLPHDEVIVHVSLELDSCQKEISDFLVTIEKVREILYSSNSPHPEVDAMEKFLTRVNIEDYSILTYMHSKGVSKAISQNIRDWTELMRYFIIEKMPLCERIFKKGYLLYGVNRTDDSNFDAHFFYAGNFVSINLTPAMISKIKSTPMEKEYYGLEGFWGKLCTSKYAYNAFYSRIDHYTNPFPERFYKSKWGRIRYSITSSFYYHYYQIKNLILKRWRE